MLSVIMLSVAFCIVMLSVIILSVVAPSSVGTKKAKRFYGLVVKDVNLFETTIRVLGGLLSAFHLSNEDEVKMIRQILITAIVGSNLARFVAS